MYFLFIPKGRVHSPRPSACLRLKESIPSHRLIVVGTCDEHIETRGPRFESRLRQEFYVCSTHMASEYSPPSQKSLKTSLL